MKIMFTYPSGWDCFSGRAHDYFIKAVAKQANCKLVGLGWPDYCNNNSDVEVWKSAGVTLDEMMSTPSWQERYNQSRSRWRDKYNYHEQEWLINYDRFQHKRNQITIYHIRKHYGNDEPDWIVGGFVHSRDINMNYKLCRWVGDKHLNTELQIDVVNNELDLLLMFCAKSNYIFDNVEKFKKCFGKSPKQWLMEGNCHKVNEDYFTSRLTTPWEFFPISVEPTVFKPRKEKVYDVSMIGSIGGFYPLRKVIAKELPALAKDKGWKILIKRPPNMKDKKYRHNINLILQDKELRKKWLVGEDYAKTVAQSKIFIFGSSIFRYPLTKYMEGMMSGSLVMADEPWHAEECHFKDGWNYVKINENNWQEKLEYYLKNDRERETIAQRGYETAMKYHTTNIRAKQFIDILKQNAD